jgi:hypothetical protein
MPPKETIICGMPTPIREICPIVFIETIIQIHTNLIPSNAEFEVFSNLVSFYSCFLSIKYDAIHINRIQRVEIMM